MRDEAKVKVLVLHGRNAWVVVGGHFNALEAQKENLGQVNVVQRIGHMYLVLEGPRWGRGGVIIVGGHGGGTGWRRGGGAHYKRKNGLLGNGSSDGGPHAHGALLRGLTGKRAVGNLPRTTSVHDEQQNRKIGKINGN